MKWREPGDPKVAQAIVATFRDSAETSSRRLVALHERDWHRTYFWLDASGLALYFTDQLAVLGIEDAIPAAVLSRLKQNLADNRARCAATFAEFAAINQEFQAAGVDYANLKGFSLSPESCPDPALRRAMDFDFLVDGAHLEICTQILASRGYIRTAATYKTWEFKAGASERAQSMNNFYKIGPHRSVELHFASLAALTKPIPCRDERLDRLTQRTWNGLTFAALSASEQFVGQALHLFGHLCGAHTRPAWVLEYRNHVAYYFNDQNFWENVKVWSSEHRDAPVAIGLASLLSTRLFGGETPRQLDEWTIDRLPPAVRLWAERYGSKVLLGDHPGTKLYLLLLDGLRSGEEARQIQKQKRRHLLPAPRVPRIVYAGPNDTLWERLAKELRQARFVLFRLRFHLIEGARYLIEAARWKRRLGQLQRVEEKPLNLVASSTSRAKD